MDVNAERIGEIEGPGRYMPGGYIEYEAPDLASAVKLASEFSNHKRYRYFRGQRDTTWAVTSSFARLDLVGRKQTMDEFAAFHAFAKHSPELLPYLQDDDALIATAQHYGLAGTTFIDFSYSPEVAGWFASDGAVGGQRGAIFLVDDRAEEMFTHFDKPGRAIRFLTLDVPNLWRLQAQQGLFLETHVDIAQIWPLDRIVFPHGPSASPIEQRHIYPDRKSALEQAIDQYQLQRSRKETFETFMQGIDRTKMAFIEMVDDDAPVDDQGPVMPEAWSTGPNERWEEIDPDSPAPRLSIEQLSGPDLETLVANRRHCTDLVKVADTGAEALQVLLDRLWSGCRPFPYSIDQLVRAVRGLVATRQALTDRDLGSGQDLREAAAELFEVPIEIAMQASGENATRAFIDASRLWSALKPEAKQRLKLEHFPASPSAFQERLQQDFRRPWVNFDETKLVELFVDQVIPWQLASGRNPVAFSAFHIITLGRP